MNDSVNSPAHYVQAAVLIEPIDILRYAPYDLGCALKYAIRAGHKDDELEDWRKAKRYIDWAIETCYGEWGNYYYTFFNKYRLFLAKVKILQEVRMNGVQFFMTDLRSVINKNIERLVNERKGF